MIRNLLALAALAVFSLDASATLTQYTLSGPVSGIVIQNDNDRSIALYDLRVSSHYVNAHFIPSGLFDTITGAVYKSDAKGPTSFGVYDSATEVYVSTMWIDFYTTETPGLFSYSARYSQVQDGGYPRNEWVTPLHPLTDWYQGSAVGAVAPSFFDSYENLYNQYHAYPDGLQVIVPTRDVPEPVSLGLFAIGAVGLAGAARRRKSHG